MAEPTKQLSVDEQYRLITRDLQEIPDTDVPRLKQLLKERGEKGEPVKIYWGTATTGKPHFGYFVPIFKISDFLQAGCHVTILFADIHAYLDNMKSNWTQLEYRCKFYEKIIKGMLSLVGVPLDKLNFVKGSDFELSKKYTLDMYKISARVTTQNTMKAGAQVVRQVASPLMSSLLYPILQALDEEYLGVDCQFGGVDQRKIFMFAKEQLPKIGYKKRIHLMNPLIPGLGKSGKMSSSEPNSKVDFDEKDDEIAKKISKAYSIDGNTENNGLLCILKYVIWRRIEKRDKPVFKVENGENSKEYTSYEEVEKDFADGILLSKALKAAILPEIQSLVTPLRKIMDDNQSIIKMGYPDEQKKVVVVTEATFGDMEVRVGKIVSVEEATRGNKLYVCQINVGGDPIQVCTGLRGKMTKEQLLNKRVLVVMNTGNVKLMGMDSCGMILVGVLGKEFALVQAPEGVPLGERVSCENVKGTPPTTLARKRLTKILSKLKSNDKGVAMWKNNVITSSKGPVTCSIGGAKIM